MTGQLLPTGRCIDTIHLPISNLSVQATFIDAGNPFVLVDAENLPVSFTPEMVKNPLSLPLELIESIRRQAAIMLGLATDLKQAALTKGTPKIAFMLSQPKASKLFGRDVDADVAVISMSMGKMHPTLQLTGAVAIASAVSVPGTLPSQISRSRTVRKTQLHQQSALVAPLSRTVEITHQNGSIVVEVESRDLADGSVHIESCGISRTARTLFEGQVRFNL